MRTSFVKLKAFIIRTWLNNKTLLHASRTKAKTFLNVMQMLFFPGYFEYLGMKLQNLLRFVIVKLEDFHFQRSLKTSSLRHVCTRIFRHVNSRYESSFSRRRLHMRLLKPFNRFFTFVVRQRKGEESSEVEIAVSQKW